MAAKGVGWLGESGQGAAWQVRHGIALQGLFCRGEVCWGRSVWLGVAGGVGSGGFRYCPAGLCGARQRKAGRVRQCWVAQGQVRRGKFRQGRRGVFV